MPDEQLEYSVFICHASEDKKEVAEPLAELLRRRGHRVWYDQFSMSAGDSLRRKIGEGVRRSKLGVVILSPRFFTKEWAQRELDALTAVEIATEERKIIPVWHQLTHRDLAGNAPELADRLALSTDKGIVALADKIERLLQARGLGILEDDSPLCPLCASVVPWPCRDCGGTGNCSDCGGRGWEGCSACRGIGESERFSKVRGKCLDCGGKGVVECWCNDGSCRTCRGSGENPEDCPICDSQIPFLPTRFLPCNFCLGEGLRDCTCSRGVCKSCSGENSDKCDVCGGLGTCRDCNGTGQIECLACRGQGRDDPRLIWWRVFERNSDIGIVKNLVRDYQVSFPLVPKQYRKAIAAYTNAYLLRRGFPSSFREKLVEFSRGLL